MPARDQREIAWIRSSCLKARLCHLRGTQTKKIFWMQTTLNNVVLPKLRYVHSVKASNDDNTHKTNRNQQIGLGVHRSTISLSEKLFESDPFYSVKCPKREDKIKLGSTVSKNREKVRFDLIKEIEPEKWIREITNIRNFKLKWKSPNSRKDMLIIPKRIDLPSIHRKYSKSE